ncbi:MAG: 30S ribosomal protein S20 [Candidatus Bipolaricaulaceae bacterium]
MPNTRSAKRRLRQSIRRRQRNDLRKAAVRHWRREIHKLVEAGKSQEAEQAFSQFQKAVDKAAAHRTIHPRRAARLKGRMARRITPS